MPSIVQVNVSERNAPSPSTLQQTSALVSQGGTTNTIGSKTLLTSSASLATMLRGALTITSLIGGGATATATLPVPHGYTIGDIVQLTITGVTGAGVSVNGLQTCTMNGASTFTFPSAITFTGAGTMKYAPEDTAELVQMNNSWWAQGASVSVNVLELGPGGNVDGPPALNTWIQANPLTVYTWVVPRYWDGAAAFMTLIAEYENPEAMTYFLTTTTVSSYTNYTNLMKDVISLIEAPGALSSEFSIAGPAWAIARRRPGSGNRVGPFAFTQFSGLTPYPTSGNGTLLTALKTANVNVIGTGSEGGISNAMIFWGTTEDGNDFNYWYAIDWVQINAKLVVANEIMNGSVDPINPLIYNQQGVNRLQDRLFNLMQQSVANGLGNGTPVRTKLDYDDLVTAIDAGTFDGALVVNAIPLTSYAALNPSDYSTGTYNGLSIQFIPSRGFISILINLVAVNFI